MKKLSNGNYSYEGAVPEMNLLFAEYFNMTYLFLKFSLEE